MEIAQEEVLTCLGVHLHDRFFRIQQKLKVEDKSWQLLFAIGIEGMRRNLEVGAVLLSVGFAKTFLLQVATVSLVPSCMCAFI
jgi:hypothetical protein